MSDDAPESPEQQEDQAAIESDYRTLANGFLTPRHRRLCQLAAAGQSNAQIARELGYATARISILLKTPAIVDEIRRLQDKLFEETIQARLKAFAEPALNNIHTILTDRSNRVRMSEKADMSKWIVEKLDGKATQKTDIGDNLLGLFMDKLDAQKNAPRPQLTDAIDVTPATAPQPIAASPEKSAIEAWVEDFCGKD